MKHRQLSIRDSQANDVAYFNGVQRRRRKVYGAQDSLVQNGTCRHRVRKPSRDSQHGATSLAQNLLRDRSEKQAFESGSSMSR